MPLGWTGKRRPPTLRRNRFERRARYSPLAHVCACARSEERSFPWEQRSLARAREPGQPGMRGRGGARGRGREEGTTRGKTSRGSRARRGWSYVDVGRRGGNVVETGVSTGGGDCGHYAPSNDDDDDGADDGRRRQRHRVESFSRAGRTRKITGRKRKKKRKMREHSPAKKGTSRARRAPLSHSLSLSHFEVRQATITLYLLPPRRSYPLRSDSSTAGRNRKKVYSFR